MDDIENIIEQVNRLMAIAEDEAASDNEIELAYGRAQKLIDRFRLENWRRDRTYRVQPIVSRMVAVPQSGWRTRGELSLVIANANDCRAYMQTRFMGRSSRKYIVFMGERSDVDAAVLLYERLDAYVSRACRGGYRRYIDECMGDTDQYGWLTVKEKRSIAERVNPRTGYYNGFRHAFNMRIRERFEEAHTQMLNIPTGRDLIASKRAHVEAEYAKLPLAKKPSRTITMDGRGKMDGREAAEKSTIGLDELTQIRHHPLIDA